jgi:hypothetical protein
MNKFVAALAMLALIAFAAWKTITDEKLLYGTWIVLGFFAVRVVLMEQRKRIDSGEQGREGRE